VHRGAGIKVTASAPAIEKGATVVLVISLGILHVTVACRVVYIVEEANRYGFGYGTLPHHPERGEEAFVVRRDARDGVSFEIRGFSRPVHPLARAGAPISRAIQVATTRRYLRAMERWVSVG
jgi:uncharacterized protein (UPF0548 family)